MQRDHFGGLLLAAPHPGLEERSLTKVNPIFRDAFHRLAIGGRTRAGQETESAHVDAEDWFDDLAKLPNDMQNCSVTSGYHQKIRRGPQFRHRMARFLSSDGCRFFFEQNRNRKT